jgi:hypothetical protein
LKYSETAKKALPKDFNDGKIGIWFIVRNEMEPKIEVIHQKDFVRGGLFSDASRKRRFDASAKRR